MNIPKHLARSELERAAQLLEQAVYTVVHGEFEPFALSRTPEGSFDEEALFFRLDKFFESLEKSIDCTERMWSEERDVAIKRFYLKILMDVLHDILREKKGADYAELFARRYGASSGGTISGLKHHLKK